MKRSLERNCKEILLYILKLEDKLILLLGVGGGGVDGSGAD